MGAVHIYSAVQDDALNVTVLIEISICTADLASQFSLSEERGLQRYSWHYMA